MPFTAMPTDSSPTGRAPVTRNPRGGRPVREEAEAIERRLREAALEVFVDNGFDGATMEGIADAAGITKRTLYSKFADKRALFLAVVPWALAQMPLRETTFDPQADLVQELHRVAHTVVAAVIDPRAVQLRRLAVHEARRFPEFSLADNLEFWVRNVRTVVDLLSLLAEEGTIVLDDVAMVADHFMALVAGGPTILADLGVVRPPGEQRRHTDHAVGLFLDGVRPR